MSTALQVIKRINPKTALEKKLYAFYRNWMNWFNDEYKARDNIFPEDVDFRSEEYVQWSREYAAAHPKPKVPKALRIDFNERALGNYLGNRLYTGYYRQPKAVVVVGEYGSTVWLIKRHADFGPVAIDIITKWEDSLTAYPSEHTERPPDIDQEVFDAFPNDYDENIRAIHERRVEEWGANEQSIAEAEKINLLIEKAKDGDQLAAASLLHDHMSRHDFYDGKPEPRINVLTFENVEPS